MSFAIKNLSDADKWRLTGQIAHAERLVGTNLGFALARDESDLDSLQDLLDQGIVSRSDQTGLQALGIALARCLLTALKGFDWATLEGPQGPQVVLRYGRSRVLLFPEDLLTPSEDEAGACKVHEIYERTLRQAREATDALLRTN